MITDLEARQFLRKIDIVLMDLQMPVMDGIEARKCSPNPKLLLSPPIIAITADVTEEIPFMDVGIDKFMKKPVVQKSHGCVSRVREEEEEQEEQEEVMK